MELLKRQQEHDIALTKSLWYNRNPERESRAQATQQKEYADDLEPMIAKIVEQIGELTLVAGRDGQVVGVPHRQTLGQWLKPGNPQKPTITINPREPERPTKPFFCEIGDPHHLEAHLIVDQSDIHLINRDRQAWIKIYGKAETTYTGRISEISRWTRQEIPPELTKIANGEVASRPDPRTGAAKPITAIYEVIVPIENPQLKLEPGLRGFAKIDGGKKPLWWWLRRWWTKLFNFQL
jgi:putative peptide zinc metalloprotease protein